MDDIDCFSNNSYRGSEIKEVIDNCKLKKLKVDSDQWRILYICNKCNAYWEKKYINSEQQGGGIPVLRKVSEKHVKKYWNI